jgi:hypothetical protein
LKSYLGYNYLSETTTICRNGLAKAVIFHSHDSLDLRFPEERRNVLSGSSYGITIITFIFLTQQALSEND